MSRRAFSLIEMIAVLVVLGILTVLGSFLYREYFTRTNDGDVQHTLRIVAADQQNRFQTRGSFVSDPTQLASLVPGASFTSGASTSRRQVSVTTGTYQGSAVLLLAVKGDSACYLSMVPDPSRGKPLNSKLASSASCTASEALTNIGNGTW